MSNKPLVAVVMGSQSDWPTMQHTVDLLKQLKVPYHTQVISAHRTPDLLFDFATNARDEGYQVVIAGAGGAAHLPGMIAAKTSVPVIGVPIKTKALNGMDSLLSMVQMPGGIPVATVAIGDAGAKNAALLAASILSTSHDDIRESLDGFRQVQTQTVMDNLELKGS
ncbi:MAG: 5-(carboxyamino)imidazole ribonucleotide mutase [Coxiellaceae bacterium]|nr:5-(carboxyamino)imidazole ribonucleotide mutase [Coxiellaceae bacterium]